jgi:transcriptional regulator with XRE-family HTH domain
MTDKSGPEKSIYTREYTAVLRLLREIRDRSGLTQIDLADRLGQTQSFVSKIERGDRRLDIVQLRTILRVLGSSLPEFVTSLEAALGSLK